MPVKKLHPSSGIGMLETLIGIAILGIILPFAYKMLIQSRQFGASSEDRLNLRSVARMIENHVDCPNLPTTCTAQQLIALPRKNGGTLVAANGQTLLLGWRVRALCTSSNQFKVQVARLGPKGEFVKDPLTGQILDWDAPRNTIFAEKMLCGSQPPAAGTPSIDIFQAKSGSSCLVSNPSLLPCNPPTPPACDPGFSTRGVSLDTFGGTDGTVPSSFGQRWIRYCAKPAAP
jgi:hypothetical protein